MSLADELILNIIEQIEDLDSLRNLALSCKKAQARSEPYLYRALHFYDGHTVVRFQAALRADPNRGRHVEHLAVRYKADNRYEIERLNVMLEHMPNLREWHIETPCPNDNLVFSFTGRFNEGAGLLRYWENFEYLQHLQLSMHTPTSQVVQHIG
jgi:hypothetical protein